MDGLSIPSHYEEQGKLYKFESIPDIEKYENKRSKCVIIKNTNDFSRKEIECDIARIKDVFKDEYSIDDETFAEMGSKDIENKLKRDVFKSSEGFDCLIVFFLTNGTEKAKLMSSKAREYELNELVNNVVGSQNGWVGKPKVFIIQAYGVKDKDVGFTKQAYSEVEEDVKLPQFSDVFYAFACLPGRFKPPGSQTFIQQLCATIDEHRCNNDLESLLGIVRYLNSESGTSQQIPVSVSTLRKRLYI